MSKESWFARRNRDLRLGGVDRAVGDDLVVSSIRDNAPDWTLRHVVRRGDPAHPRVLDDPPRLIGRPCLPGFGSGAARIKYEATFWARGESMVVRAAASS